MKLKSLLAIVSCSAIALSIGVPSIAETVKDSSVESSSIGIGNKDYRNKQSTPSIVGSWKSITNEKGLTIERHMTYRANGTYKGAFAQNGQVTSQDSGTWKYSNNLMSQNYDAGGGGQAVIKWISDNEFTLTIISNGDPYYQGAQRRFYRQQQTVTETQQDRLRRARTEGQLRAVPYQNDVLIRTLRGSGY